MLLYSCSSVLFLYPFPDPLEMPVTRDSVTTVSHHITIQHTSRQNHPVTTIDTIRQAPSRGIFPEDYNQVFTPQPTLCSTSPPFFAMHFLSPFRILNLRFNWKA